MIVPVISGENEAAANDPLTDTERENKTELEGDVACVRVRERRGEGESLDIMVVVRTGGSVIVPVPKKLSVVIGDVVRVPVSANGGDADIETLAVDEKLLISKFEP